MLQLFKHKNRIEAGCDEAGRGCLAGPVYAAAVVLNPAVQIEGLNDSKKLSPQERETVRYEVEQKARAWAVASVDNHEIDEINILNASYLAMHRALDQLPITPEFLLIDGNRFNPYHTVDFECVVGGDGKFQSIAAASILAKTWRDDHMQQLHREDPRYSWASNKGYPTAIHRQAIRAYGPSPFHRQSFRLFPLPEQGTFF